MDAIARGTRKLLWLLFISTRGLLWTLLVGAGGLLLAMYTFQNKLVYVPNMPPEARTELPDPRQFQLRYEGNEILRYFLILSPDITLHTPDGEKIHCWFFKHDYSKESMNTPTVV